MQTTKRRIYGSTSLKPKWDHEYNSSACIHLSNRKKIIAKFGKRRRKQRNSKLATEESRARSHAQVVPTRDRTCTYGRISNGARAVLFHFRVCGSTCGFVNNRTRRAALGCLFLLSLARASGCGRTALRRWRHMCLFVVLPRCGTR
jgi:hypothetical protein